jgi:hypothetical protein
MFDKILSIFGFQNRIYSWSELHDSVRAMLTKKIFYFLVLILFSITYGIYVHSAKEFLLLLLFSVIYGGTVFYNYLIFVYRKFVLITGECVEVKQGMVHIKKFQFSSQSAIVVKNKDGYFEAYVTNANKYRKGYEVAIYALEKSIYQSNQDYYIVLNPITVCIEKKGNAYEKSSR